MLEFYFKYRGVLRRLRDGALGNEMDRIAAHFSDLGYKRTSAKSYISRLGRFSEFAGRAAGAATIDQDVIDRFLLSLQATSRASAHERQSGTPAGSRLNGFQLRAARRQRIPMDLLLAAYLDHLLRVRGLEPKTCEGLLLAARRILAWLRRPCCRTASCRR